MNRKVLVALALLACAAAAFAAGGGEQKASTAAKSFTALVVKNNNIPDMETNKLTVYMEKKTGVHINWMVVPDASAISLTFASGDLPDFAFVQGNIGKNDEMRYAANGVVVPIDSYIAKSSPNFQKFLGKYPIVRQAITLPDGHIYQMPNDAQDNHGYVGRKAWIYKPWLDKLGMALPVTTDDFYNVLKAFKTRDPNGNGKADEIPMSGAVKTWNARPDDFLLSAFVLNSNKKLIVNNGKVEFAPVKPEWKDGLKYIQKLHNEGLIDPAAYTQDLGQLGSLAENKSVNIVGSYAAGHLAMAWSLSPGGRALAKEGVALLPLKGPTGRQITSFGGLLVPGGATPSHAIWPAFFVTKACKDVAGALAWVDYFWTEEGAMWGNFGEKGVDWREAKTGEAGMLGQPAVWSAMEKQVQSEEGSQSNSHWFGMNPGWYGERERLGMAQGPDSYEVLLSTVSQQYSKFVGKEDFPAHIYVELEYADELAQLETVITSFVDQAVVQAITGGKNLDAEWDGYLKQLNNLGLARYLEIYQKAYTRQYGAK